MTHLNNKNLLDADFSSVSSRLSRPCLPATETLSSISRRVFPLHRLTLALCFLGLSPQVWAACGSASTATVISGAETAKCSLASGESVEVTNSGSITASLANGIEINATNSVANGIVNNGIITSTGNARGIEIDRGTTLNGGINNSGTVSAEGYGIELGESSAATLNASGTGPLAGIAIYNSGTVRTINSSFGDSSAIRIARESVVTGDIVNTASGSISSVLDGINLNGSTSALNGNIINDGNLLGVRYGIINSGQINGNIVNNSTGTIGVSGTVGNPTAIFNSTGTISGDIINAGNINGVAYGIYNSSTMGNIINTGTISASSGVAINYASVGRGGDITNSGTISGGFGIIVETGNNNITITNRGVIGGGPTSIRLGGNSNTLLLDTGSILNGNVTGGDTDNLLQLLGSGSEDSNFTGFGTLTMAGTDWLLSGNITTNNTTTAATTVQNGTLTLAGTLTNSGVGGGTTIASGAGLQVGNGGNSGTITGDIVNNGTLTFNRSDDSSYTGMLSGAGDLNKQGAGVLNLTSQGGSQSSVDVQQGTLQFMQDGAFTTLGNYTTQEGATTNIGQINSTLNIGGIFTQAADSILNITLGSSPDITARGAALDGTLVINGFNDAATPVKASEAIAQDYTMLRTTEEITGDFDNNPLIPSTLDYLLHDGFVSNDKLEYNLGFRLAWTQGDLGEKTGNFTLGANTAFDIDVVLTDQTGAFSSGWDGKTLTKEGDGMLVLSAANTYTGNTLINGGTLQTRIANAFTQSNAVTLGQGATFDLNGFDQLANNLTGAGDIQLGSAVLTINNTINTVLSGVISGSGSVVKNGDSTLVLTGANSYNGDTSLKQGRIDVGHNSALGNGALLMDDGTVLGFAADNLSIANNINLTGSNDPVIDTGATRQTLSGVISGSGILSKEGSGTLIFTGTNTYNGATNINQGTLQAGTVDTFSPSSNHNLAAGSLLNLDGFNQTLARLDNAGSVSLSGAPGTVLTVNGDYIGSNGILNVNTVLNDDSSATDKLIVNGNTSGSTLVSVTNAGGIGAATLNGIQLVQVNGLSDGEFVQNGRIVAGAYDYSLARGLGNNATNWYLTSTTQPTPPEPTPPEPTPMVERPEAGGYASNLSAANTLFVTRLHDRLGETQYIDALTGERKVTSLWLRNQGGHNRSRYDDGQLSTQANRYVMLLGGDIAQWSNNGQDRLHLGAMAGYANNKSSTISRYSGYRANASIDGYSVGLYGTWYANQADKNGFYLDTWAQYSWFKNSVDGQQLSSEKYDANGFTASIESGYTFKLSENSTKNLSYFIQPQAQLVWMGVKADEHQEVNGTNVAGEGDGNIQSRLGVKAFIKGHSAQDEGKDRLFQPFVAANWIHNSKDFGATLNNYTVKQDGAANIAELTLGLEGQWNKNVNIWGNVGQQIGDKGYSDTSVMLGGKYLF